MSNASTPFTRRLARALERRIAAARLWPAYRRLAPLGHLSSPRMLRLAVRSATRAGQLPDAQALLAKTLDSRPNWHSGQVALAEILASNGATSEALERWRLAAALKPTDTASRRNMVDLSLQLQDARSAFSALAEWEALDGRTLAYLDREARAWRLLGDRAAEAGVLSEWLDQQPGKADARWRYAQALEAIGDLTGALEAVEAVKGALRKSSAVKRALRRLSAALGRVEVTEADELAALGRLRQAAQAEATAPAGSREKAARWFLASGAAEEAAGLWGSGAAPAATDAELYVQALSFELTGRYEEAAKAYDLASAGGERFAEGLALVPSTDVSYDRGRSLHAAGHNDAALAELRAWGSRIAPTPRGAALLANQGALTTEEEVEGWLELAPLGTASPVDRKTVLNTESKVRRALFARALGQPLRTDTVFFQSSRASRLHCNPLALYREAAADPRFADFHFVWASDKPASVPADVSADPRVRFVRFNSPEYLEALGTSGWVINNVTFPDYYSRRAGQKYLNTWHGTPLKGLGRHAKDSELSYANVARNVLLSTHLGMPNEHTAVAMEEGMGLRGIVPGKVAVTGSPRVDVTVNATAEFTRSLKARLGIDDDKAVVLFAPTWKGSLGSVTAPTGLATELAAMGGNEHHLLFRGHRFAERALAGMTLPATTVPPDVDTNELLSVVDVLVTDFSSICFDFLPTGRPVIFHVPDLEEYEADRGLQISPEDWPGIVSHSLNATVSAIQTAVRGEEDEEAQLTRARGQQRFCALEDGNAAKRTLEWFVFDADLPDAAPRLAEDELRLIGVPSLRDLPTAATSAPRSETVAAPVVLHKALLGHPAAQESFIQAVGDGPHILRGGGLALTAEERFTEAVARRTGSQMTLEQDEWLKSAAVRAAARQFGGLRAGSWTQAGTTDDGLEALFTTRR